MLLEQMSDNQNNSLFCPLFVSSFIPFSRRLLATGDALGTLMIWQLSDELSIQANREMESLADIADSALDL